MRPIGFGDFMLLIVLMTALFIILMNVESSSGVPVQSVTQAMSYLSKFGYLNQEVRNHNSGALINEDVMKKAVMEFQAFAGLNATGELDRETVETMKLPRCGVKDKDENVSNSRSKRFVLQGGSWKVKDLTYKISKYPRKPDRAKVDTEMSKAFKVWSQHTDLTFTKKTSGKVHIEVRFEKGDGEGVTLAYAYFPNSGGDAYFDTSENWTIGSNKGTNLFQVAAHEFGHSLGLDHSNWKTVMAPFYRNYNPNFRLHEDDIKGIQALYGKKNKKQSKS